MHLLLFSIPNQNVKQKMQYEQYVYIHFPFSLKM